MAIMTVRSTYALDPETVRTLEEMAQRWRVSKSEALRRAIRAAAGSEASRHSSTEALDRLQEELRLTARSAGAWVRRVQRERRLGSREPGA